MNENKYDGTVCDTCEQDFQNEINELVDNVENHTRSEYDQKKDEVEDAFGIKGEQC